MFGIWNNHNGYMSILYQLWVEEMPSDFGTFTILVCSLSKGKNHSLSQSGQAIHSLHNMGSHRLSTLGSIAVQLSPQQQNFLLVTKKGRIFEIIKIFGPMRGKNAFDTTLWSAVFECDKHLNQRRANVITIWINGRIVSDGPIRI